MSRLPSLLFACSMVLFSCTFCSIKEDRSSCPCCIVLDLSGAVGKFDSLCINIATTSGPIIRESVREEDFISDYKVYVPRDNIFLNVYNGYEDRVMIPVGEDCPPLWKHSSVIDARDELVQETVIMRKSWCRVGLKMISGEGAYPFALELTGWVCGYDRDGSPLSGEFSYSPVPDADGFCSINVPRQVDGSLALRISEGGESLRVFALGEYILESGYDWSSEDLEDVDVEIDYSKTDVVFRVGDWEKVFTFDIVI